MEAFTDRNKLRRSHGVGVRVSSPSRIIFPAVTERFVFLSQGKLFAETLSWIEKLSELRSRASLELRSERLKFFVEGRYLIL